MMLTSHSGGLRETLDAVVVVKPFDCCRWNEEDGEACITTRAPYMCVVTAAVQRVGEMQELLGIHLNDEGAAVMPVGQFQVFVRCGTTSS
ncbi:hypothetical protein GH5_06694 [Leishmania sp. Ghana 2012 LV757]|uniref:hypothetical protein n=1 Tax=Leishmania sp. Ghana 2012 LV757 TaxID=2803181 RepID=UPI001B443C2F|nr:hypothetical protein GH5_06694 [Leishmania sp. Ghana 2012 LV757]